MIAGSEPLVRALYTIEFGGVYERVLSPGGTGRTLGNSHHQVFSEWLGFGLPGQKSDLGEYLGGAGMPWQALDYRDPAGSAHGARC